MCGNPFGTLTDLARALEISPAVNTPVPVTAPPQITCAHCRARVDATFEWCPKCGSPLHATPCVYCGRTIPARLDQCPSCGAPVQVLNPA